MKLYCYIPDRVAERFPETPKLLTGILERAGVDVITKERPVEDAFPDTFRQVQERGESFLDHVSGIIIEGSEPDADTGYLLAYAVAQKKPALLLLRKGRAAQNPMARFGRRVPDNLVVMQYDDEKCEKALLQFLRGLGDISYHEVPSIKFTLRITPQIEHYLHWKTLNTKLTKADFLRKVILEEIIARDEEFKRYRERRSKRDEEPE